MTERSDLQHFPEPARTRVRARWEAIYGSGQQLNLYPHDQVVSWFMRRFPDPRRRRAARVLELGCGAGNNLWFLARAGFRSAGIDISASGVAFASQRLVGERLNVDLVVGSFDALPYVDSSFDIVLDRGALAAVDFSTARAAIAEAHRVLSAGGTLIVTPVAEGTRIEPLKDSLIGHRWRDADVRLALPESAWRIEDWWRTERRPERGGVEIRVEWWIEAQRR